ncbi:hypothetical protein KEM55_000275 [Ascosphaera atra]|nr:hypothetical protein KEM55_000275 [Ascosphaera atra]
MAFPREVAADEHGNLCITSTPEVIHAAFKEEAVVDEAFTYLKSPGTLKTEFLTQPSSVSEGQLIRFEATPSLDTASFGLLIRTDNDLAGYWLKFLPQHSEGRRIFYTITLTMNPAPLDDFWADQYRLYFHREVDGNELVRHDQVALKDTEAVQVLLLDETIEVFAGGKAMSYRFGKNGRPNVKDAPLALFVDDGEVEFKNLKVFLGN